MKNIAIFASGTGSNARKIIEYFGQVNDVAVRLIVTNRPDAPVLGIAREHGIEALILDRASFYGSEALLDALGKKDIDFIALAGFLWLIPAYLVRAFEGRMVNIHPALLPKYGGKGMYGMRVHEAVAAAGDPETGISIHYVNEHYDDGAIIFQARCAVMPHDSPESIAGKVRQLEHRYYPQVIDELLRGN